MFARNGEFGEGIAMVKQKPQIQLSLRLIAPSLAISFVLMSANETSAAVDFFGAWTLNRQTSNLTRQPTNAETVIIMPWGPSGWVWTRISGGRYQPEDLIHGLPTPPEVDGPAADSVSRASPSSRDMYYATWDGKPYRSYGRGAGQVQLRKLTDQTFEAASSASNSTSESSSLAFSPDGKHLTVANGDDRRVYDRIDPATWPSRTIEPSDHVPPPGAGLPCSGIWTINEQLTHRSRSPIPPGVQYFGPWGKNGWMWLNTASMDAQGAELVSNQFNGNSFQVYAADSHEQAVRQLDDHTFGVTSVRYHLAVDRETVKFTNDCKRVTITVPEGTDRRKGVKYYNDIRVFDAIAP
jgi:hypothetical protein